MKKTITAILIGGGNRGKKYTDIMARMGDAYKVIAVAEPIESRRRTAQETHGIPDDMCFSSWEDLLALGKIADVAVIATMDRQHRDPAIAAISLKYDILLEKPVSPDPKECLEIANHAEENGVRVVVCHVLRYTPFFITIKDIIDRGELGEIISINHEECVGNTHQSHSFVRGNWRNSQRASCMLLQKCCHDMDILQWLLGKQCKKVSSFGSLTHFKASNAPEGAPERCMDGCPHGEICPYNAVKLYLEDKNNIWFRSACTKNPAPTDELVEQALRETQYGKCVYKCDNDVVDHQVVNLLFEDDATVTFTMNAFNKGGRHIHIMGTKGELHASMEDAESPIRVYSFETKQTKEIPMFARDGIMGGHGGGDDGIIMSLYEYLTDTYTGCSVSDIRTSVNNHLIVFAAEEARKTGTVVDLEEFARGLLET